jgi:hypothetical protein
MITRLARGVLAVAALVGACLAISPGAQAATLERGLQLSPLRQYIALDDDKSHANIVTLANLTEKPITVALSVENFGVTDFTYDYTFVPANDSWVRLSKTLVELDPGKSQSVSYEVKAPVGAAPGGHYFTIMASSNLGNNANNRVRAATLLYITAGGEVTRSTSLQKSTLPWISFGGAITFSQTIHGSGNTHTFVYPTGQLHGPSAQPAGNSEAHIIMPGTTRTVADSMQPPRLPGVYRATIGYKTDAGQQFITTRYTLYVPPWSFCLPIGALLIILAWQRRRRAVAKDLIAP